ncbi:hypothetical protein GGR93_002164 [Sulfitobacter noctilucicola]|uniref:Chemotaxis protein CheA n=2 Tax=Sulfitobacter noctilucicola TaxID=1342301 RepID=A0A7W6M8S1_9RHOB|nr:hypothetical protein [Sulfitobacter noctilucicola]MBB4174391.1 hypothetical protein [Sulfitobacter noctilucicola]
MSNNKILTVSYGTFSCTLEGFDDSFGTMKAIAEYFRDLAADDRYFGAEPPQPDAEMLARIAQKEVSRKVQAREQDGKIVLSALEDKTETIAPSVTAAPAAAALAAGAVATTVADVAVEAAEAEAPKEEAPETAELEVATAPIEIGLAGLTENDLVIEDAPEEEVIEETLTSVEPEALDDVEDTDANVSIDVSDVDQTAEAKLDDLSALVRESEEAAEAAEPETDVDGVISVEAVEDENDIVPGQPDADVEAFFADSPSAVEPEDTGFEDTQDVTAEPLSAAAKPAEELDPNSIAAKLQRIRAVVAQHEEAEDDDDYLEDEHAEAAQDKASDVIADARTDIEDALEADDAAEEAEFSSVDIADDEGSEAAGPTISGDDDDVTAILDRLAADTEAPAPPSVEAPSAELTAKEPTSADEPSVEDSISNLFDENVETLDAAPEAAPVPLRKTPRVTVRTVSHAPTSTPKAEEDSAQPEEKPAPRARVIKVKRADLEAAIEKGDLEEYGDEDDTAQADAPKADTPRGLNDIAPARNKAQTALSPEDEAELARELAELEEDISAGVEEDHDADDQPTAEKTPVRARSALRRALPSIDENADVDVNRLLAETDHQMDEPESATRRDAFAHLRAAVAAKKADVAAGDSSDGKDTDGAYREDLAEVVRPRRPISRAARTERPSEDRPAPLKLVAEQRVDADKPRTAGPVRPRRVSAQTETAPQSADGESFADFAAEMGAATLPQLLEAAAAYMSFVEGREQFSRPQLMTKVRQAGVEDGFSREDGLRSFGQLLRAGKIEKIKGGRFTVSDDIGYRPDHRAAG